MNKLIHCQKNILFHIIHHLEIIRSINDGIGQIHRSDDIYTEACRSYGFRYELKYYCVMSSDKILLLGTRLSQYGNIICVYMIWSCPFNSISEFHSDINGDLILKLKPNESVCFNKNWYDNRAIINSIEHINQYLFQSTLESLTNISAAKMYVIDPLIDDCSYVAILKRKSSGVFSLLKTDNSYEYRLKGFVLYEYIDFVDIDIDVSRDEDTMNSNYYEENSIYSISQHQANARHNRKRSYSDEYFVDANTHSSKFSSPPRAFFEINSPIGRYLMNGICTDRSEAHSKVNDKMMINAYPLVNVNIIGPTYLSNDCYSLSIAHMHSNKGDTITILSRDKSSILRVDKKDSVTLLFKTELLAQEWKHVLVYSNYSIVRDGISNSKSGPHIYTSGCMNSLRIPLAGVELERAENVKVVIASSINEQSSS